MQTYKEVISGESPVKLSNKIFNKWEDCFRKPKLLLAANKLIYWNIAIGISKTHGP